ncbi:uncharacterized protein BDV17DRAFT_264298 [Aspergillus undulatus]|uniref:uncharacterized protein n=1 Tax=Aspergillus undulatus TaxID=1810928 RepID=UPI003CCD9B2D
MNTDIQLIDNTAPAGRNPDDAGGFSWTNTTTSNGSRLWSRPSIRAERAKRRYAKWQPERFGIGPEGAPAPAFASASAAELPESEGPSSSDNEGGLLRAGTNTNSLANASTIQEGASTINYRNGYQSDTQPLYEQTSEAATGEQTQQQDFGTGASRTGKEIRASGSGRGTTHQAKNHPKICGLKPGSELDILYENQRGWFLFGIPLYSNQSLLNIDPAPWQNASGKRSFVNITNAQVPDPSWEWAWKTWYVDMSGDVDEQGWQYAFSFSLSSHWHGTHPFWHSFVRRRRWVRLRVKKVSPSDRERWRRSRTGLEMGHTLNEDYFTIHTAVKKKRASSSERASRATSLNLGRVMADREEGVVDEIRNVPALMYAIKAAIVDREKLDAVRKFVDDGGDELYYLDGKIPEIMTRLVYQTSRWQLLTYLHETIQDIFEQQKQESSSEQTRQETEDLRCKQEYLSRAAGTAVNHVGPDVLQVQEPDADAETDIDNHSKRAYIPPAEILNPPTGNRRDSLLSRVRDSGKFSFKPMNNGGEIKGIPRDAEIGHDFHIY